jgi:hypothetical protein
MSASSALRGEGAQEPRPGDHLDGARAPDRGHQAGQPAAEAEPSGHAVTALGPREHPRDRAQILEGEAGLARRRARPQRQLADVLDRRGGQGVARQAILIGGQRAVGVDGRRGRGL